MCAAGRAGRLQLQRSGNICENGRLRKAMSFPKLFDGDRAVQAHPREAITGRCGSRPEYWAARAKSVSRFRECRGSKQAQERDQNEVRAREAARFLVSAGTQVRNDCEKLDGRGSVGNEPGSGIIMYLRALPRDIITRESVATRRGR